MTRDVIELTSALVRLDTAGANEDAAARLLAEELSSAGMTVELDVLARGRSNLIARSTGDGRDPIVLSGHLDTVPFKSAGWTVDPLSAHICDGRIHGRGTSDMKAGVAALVLAAKRHLDRTGGNGDIMLVLSAGEESGCEGARHLVDHVVLPRGGPLLVGEPTANRLVPGHKGVLWLKVSAQGLAAHGSQPDLGRSAITPLARLAVALAEESLARDHPVMGSVTASVGTFDGGTKTNLVADSASMTVDVRTVPGTSSRELIKRVAALADSDVRIEPIIDFQAIYTPPENGFLNIVSEVLDIMGKVAEPATPATYFSDASVLAESLASSGVVLLGPGDPDQTHTTDESCSIDRIHQAAEIYEQILDRWCR